MKTNLIRNAVALVSMLAATLSATPFASAAGSDVDRAFIDMMVPHHESGIEMARMAESKAHGSEVKQFATKTADEQQKDIQKLKALCDKSFSGEPKADQMAVAGKPMTMAHMSRQTEEDMKKLREASGHEFDRTFLDIFTAHHQMAIDMSREEISRGADGGVKGMAQATIAKQTKEIGEMDRMKREVGSADRGMKK